MTLEGYAGLRARMDAIAPSHTGLPMMRLLGAVAIREQRLMAPRRTGNLQRTIHVDEVTPVSVRTVASASYAADVEHGTRPHLILPRNRQALRFAVGGGARLTGSARKGAGAIFAKVVHHPGTRPQPFMVPGAERAISVAGLAGVIVAAWNRIA